jgi:lysophospholipase L1-like esterase
MAIKNQQLLYCSLCLNFILLLLFLTLFLERDFRKAIQAKTIKAIGREQQTSKTQRPRLQRVGYYQARKAMFAGLPDSKSEIVFLGDSLTDQGEWAELFKNGDIINRGISGDTTTGIIERLDEIIRSQPDKIFLMIGINDLWNEHKTVPEIVSNYQKILEKIAQKSPQTQIFMQSILPINQKSYQIAINNQDIVKVNQQLSKLAKQLSYNYLNLHDSFLDNNGQLDVQYTMDGVHLNDRAYLLWKKIVEPYVRE